MRSRALVILAIVAVAAVTVGVLLYKGREGEPAFEVQINAVDPADLGVDEWLEDFRSLCDFVEGNYPYLELKERTHGYNWLDLREGFEERIRAAPDSEGFLQVIMDAVGALQNRHTHVLRPEEVTEYHTKFQDSTPMNLVFCDEVAEAAEYWAPIYDAVTDVRYNRRFEARIVYDRGDYIVTDYYGNPLTEYGVRVTEVNGVPIDDAVMTCLESSFIDWDFQRSKHYLWWISPQYFGADALFTVLDPGGQETGATFQTYGGPSSFWALYPSPLVDFEMYEDEGVAYMYVKTFDLSRVEPYYDDVMEFYGEIADYEHLIIDIRGNTGGTFQSWIDGIVGPLIEEDMLHEYYLAYRTGDYVQWFHEGYLSDKVVVSKDLFDYLPPEVRGEGYEIYNFSSMYTATHEAGFNGEIILLTDNIVYSAAEGFTNFCKQTGFAEIYGIPSGGDGFFVWPTYFVLPDSKLVITTSSSMSLDVTGCANEEARTQPDVLHETAFMAFDELIDFVLQDITQGE